MNKWPADAIPVGTRVNIIGEVWFLHTEGYHVRFTLAPTSRLFLVGGVPEAPKVVKPAHYMEVMNAGPGGESMRWPVFGNVRQLGLPDTTRRTMLRGKEGPRLIISAARFEAAKAEGKYPQIDYAITNAQPTIGGDGIPCTVQQAPMTAPAFAGHRVLLIDPEYRADGPEVIEA